MKGGVPAQVDSRDLQSNIDIVDEVFGYMDDDPYVCGEFVWAHVFAVDGRGAKTRAAADFVDFALSGPGEILGAGNGDACELVPFTQSAGHRLFGGCATAVIRRTGPGRIELRAKSPTLGSAAVELPVGRSD